MNKTTTELLADALALEQENAHQTGLLAAIAYLARSLEDRVPELSLDVWYVVRSIRQLARNEITAAEALAEEGEE